MQLTSYVIKSVENYDSRTNVACVKGFIVVRYFNITPPVFTRVVHLNAVQYCSMLLDLSSTLVSAVREPQDTYLLHRIAMYYQYIDAHCTSAASNGSNKYNNDILRMASPWTKPWNPGCRCPMLPMLAPWTFASGNMDQLLVLTGNCNKMEMCAMRAEYAANTLWMCVCVCVSVSWSWGTSFLKLSGPPLIAKMVQ